MLSFDPQKTQLNERGDADFAYANNFARYRTSIVRSARVDLVFPSKSQTKVRTMESSVCRSISNSGPVIKTD